MPTAEDWRLKAKKAWNLTHGTRPAPVTLPTALVPNPVKPGSSHYLFRGRPFNQLVLSAFTPGSISPGLEPLDDEDKGAFDIDEIADLATAVARTQAAEGENDVLRATIESLQALNAQMQVDFQAREKALEDELQLHMREKLRLENEIRVAKGGRTFFLLTFQNSRII
jgi:hypothetical protein